MSSVSAITFYLPNSPVPINCGGVGTTCGVIPGNVYRIPNHPDNNIGVVDPIIYSDLQRTN